MLKSKYDPRQGSLEKTLLSDSVLGKQTDQLDLLKGNRSLIFEGKQEGQRRENF